MKNFCSICLSAVLALSAGVASANTLNLSSYGSTATAPAGVSNSATYVGVGGTTYDIGTGGVWSDPIGNSSWVSQNAGNYPGGSNVEPTGTYTYFSTFTDVNGAGSSGVLNIMADDTTSVSLNGHLIVSAASMATNGTCAASQPTCTSVDSLILPTSDFLTGLNVLSFGVVQQHGSAEGLDFTGTVNVTPEPNSLLLMATGLMAMSGLLYYRRVQA